MFKYFGIVQYWQLRLKVGSYFGSLPFLKVEYHTLVKKTVLWRYHVLIKTPFPLRVSKSGHKAVHFWDCWRFRPKYIENTFKAIQRTFRALEMHSRWRCKICTCSVTLGELQSFGNYKGLIIIFFRWNLPYNGSETFSNSSLHQIFESENFRFLFSTKNSVTWEVKCKN